MPSKYLQLCQSSDESFLKLLTKGFIDRTRHEESDYEGQAENAVAKTWLISFKHVRQLDTKAGVILEFLCFISEKDIPLFILQYEDPELKEAIGVLQSYAFITAREDGQVLDMHRLVRLTTWNWLEENETFVQVYDLVLLRLRDLLVKCQLKEHDRRGKLMPHAQSVVNNNTRSDNLPARFRMLHTFSRALYWEEDKFEVAIRFMREAEIIGMKTFDESHRELMSARTFLARLLQVSGHTSEALEILGKNLQFSQKKGGEKGPEALSCAAYRAFMVQHSEPAEAETILQQTLQSQRRVLGEEHEDTILTKENLVTCLLKLSRYKDAEAMARQVLHTQLKKPGSNELTTTGTMLDLSQSLLRQGLLEEAEQLARRSYLIRITTTGNESSFTCDSLTKLANVLVAAGKYHEAEGELRSLLKIEESISKEESPERLSGMLTLAYFLIKTAKDRDAAEVLQEAKERCLIFHGKEHRGTIAYVTHLKFTRAGLDQDVDTKGSKV